MTGPVAILVVDHGMWRDPTILGPFADREAAAAHVAQRWPDMTPEYPDADPNHFRAGDDEALIIPMEVPA